MGSDAVFTIIVSCLAGNAMVIILLLASLNSCTNPWIYMAFTDNICKRVSYWWQQKRGKDSDRGSTLYSSADGPIKSTYMSRGETTTNGGRGLFFANENAIQLGELKKNREGGQKRDNGVVANLTASNSDLG